MVGIESFVTAGKVAGHGSHTYNWKITAALVDVLQELPSFEESSTSRCIRFPSERRGIVDVGDLGVVLLEVVFFVSGVLVLRGFKLLPDRDLQVLGQTSDDAIVDQLPRSGAVGGIQLATLLCQLIGTGVCSDVFRGDAAIVKKALERGLLCRVRVKVTG